MHTHVIYVEIHFSYLLLPVLSYVAYQHELVLELELFLRRRAFDADVAQVTFALQDMRDGFLDLGMRHLNVDQLRVAGVADARE